MIIIGLYDNLYKGLKLYQDLAELKSIKLFLLVCKNSKSLIRRILSYIKQWIKLSFYYKILFFKLLKSRKLKISVKGIEDPRIILWIKQKRPDIGCHGMGIIYSEKIISLFKMGILNSHIGILPKYRGRSVMEWSLFNGDKTGITVFFIDYGIDTGRRIVLIEEINLNHCKSVSSAKKYLFSLGNSMLKKALLKLEREDFRFIVNDISKGKRYYVMSNLFSNVVNKILEFNNYNL